MNAGQRREIGKGALQIVDEAVHLLRLAPVSTLAAYYIGALPFVLALLYYWADMSHSATAQEHHAESAFALSLVFLWMKVWQTVFALKLKSQLSASSGVPWSAARIFQISAVLAVIQSTAFIALPIAALATLPLGWVFAFYQSVAVVAGDGTPAARAVINRAKRQAGLWPKQNHLVLAILLGFSFFVFLNIGLVLFFLPHLFKIFTGVETAFTQSWESILNTTFFAVGCAGTYLCVDPLVRTVYVLRCFYGESIESGADLKAELKAYSASTSALVPALLLVFCAGTSLQAAEAPPALPSPVQPQKLESAIAEVLERREFAWRMPREEAVKPAEDGLLKEFFKSIGKTVTRFLDTLWGWGKDLIKWLVEKLSPKESGMEGGGGWSTLRVAAYGLVAALAMVLAVLLWKTWRKRRWSKETEPVAAAALPADLKDENVLASHLPEEGWLNLAREMLEKREYRLALRRPFQGTLSSKPCPW